MTTSYGALCNDFMTQALLSVKMPLPSERDTVMHFFERMKRVFPSVNKLRKFPKEFILESARETPTPDPYRWFALQRKSTRSGILNPVSMQQAFKQHEALCHTAPHYLGITSLDLDSVEVVYTFELECKGDQDEIVAGALMADSPLGNALAVPNARLLNAAPVASFAISRDGRTQGGYDIKTRHKGRRGLGGNPDEPLSIALCLRQLGPFPDLDELPEVLAHLNRHADALAQEHFIPNILNPISRHIAAGHE